MGIFNFKLPELGEGIYEGELLSWHIKLGEQVTEDQIIADVQNDKSVVELPSPVNGKVVELKVPEGTVCTIEDVIIVFEVDSNDHVEDPGTREEVEIVSDVSANLHSDDSGLNNNVSKHPGHHIMATPSVRKLAREKGITLSDITGTGKNGRITREDVLSFSSTDSVPTIEEGPTTSLDEKINVPSLISMAGGEEERAPLKGIRKVIANAMVKSKQTAAHVTIMDEVNVTELIALRTKANKLFAEEKGIRLSYLPFITKVLVSACRQFPVMNASIDDEKNEVIYKKYYHIGIATDTENGLIVPVITNAQSKTIWDIATEIKGLAARGKEGKLASHELKGSTITITNIGSVGGMIFTPIINHPEVAILGIGRITEKPVVKNGEIIIASIMTLSLSFDHRLIDGVTAQHFINYIKRLLENPELLVTEI